MTNELQALEVIKLMEAETAQFIKGNLPKITIQGNMVVELEEAGLDYADAFYVASGIYDRVKKRLN